MKTMSYTINIVFLHNRENKSMYYSTRIRAFHFIPRKYRTHICFISQYNYYFIQIPYICIEDIITSSSDIEIDSSINSIDLEFSRVACNFSDSITYEDL